MSPADALLWVFAAAGAVIVVGLAGLVIALLHWLWAWRGRDDE